MDEAWTCKDEKVAPRPQTGFLVSFKFTDHSFEHSRALKLTRKIPDLEG